MGVFQSKTVTDPIAYKASVNEDVCKNNIIDLTRLLSIISKKYDNTIYKTIKDKLSNEIPLAANFIVAKYTKWDIYNEYDIYKICQLSDWHKHDYSFQHYLQVLKYNNNLNGCKILLSNRQLKLYQFLNAESSHLAPVF